MKMEDLQNIIDKYKSTSKYSGKQKVTVNKDGSLSVFVHDLLIFKLITQSKQYKLTVKYDIYDYSKPTTKDGFATYVINIGNEHEIEEYIPLIFKGVDKYVYDNYVTYTFGCCSRFVACSDAKHCIHPDELHAKGCMYKGNLDKGRIFYGKNKNV